MTNPDFTIKEQSDRPTFADELTDADGNAVDLTNATEVRFYQWGPAGNLLINDATAASITDAATGSVEYDYAQGQVVRQGANPAEWRVEYSDGDIQWFPQTRNLEILVAKSGGDREIAVEDLDPKDATVSVLTADRVVTGEADIGTLTAPVDAAGNDIQNAGSVGADKQSLTGGVGPLAIVRDPSTGNVETENYDSVQAAIDALPNNDSFGSSEGMVFVPSRGNNPAYQGPVTYSQKGGTLKGSGIHCKIEHDGPEATISVEDGDSRISGFWVDNQGSGDAIHIANGGGQVYIDNVNVDDAGDYGINLRGSGVHWVGPNVEVKAGGVAGIASNGSDQARTFIHDSRIEHIYADAPTLETGIRVGGWSRVSDVIIEMSRDYAGGTRGFRTTGGATQPWTFLSNVTVKVPTRSDGATTGPTIGFSIDNEHFYGHQLVEEACSTGLRFRSEAANCYVHGRFPSGVEVQSGATDIWVWDPETTRADVSDSGTRTVLNGVGLNAGDPNTTGEWNGAGREGVHVYDTTNSVLYHYVNGTWV